MPTYTYQCTKCDFIFDEQHTIANREAPLSEPCPTCGKSGSIDKLLTSPLICDSVRVLSLIHILKKYYKIFTKNIPALN